MQLSRLIRVSVVPLCCAIISALALPMTSSPVPEPSGATPSKEAAFKMCLEQFKQLNYRKPTAEEENGNRQTPAFSSKTSPEVLPAASGIDCKAVFGEISSDMYGEMMMKSGIPQVDSDHIRSKRSAEKQAVVPQGEIQKRAAPPSSNLLNAINERSLGGGIPSPSQLLAAHGGSIDPEGLEALLEAHRLVSRLLEHVGVDGQGERNKNMAVKGDSNDKTEMILMARMQVLAKLQQALLRDNLRHDQTAGMNVARWNPAVSSPTNQEEGKQSADASNSLLSGHSDSVSPPNSSQFSHLANADPNQKRALEKLVSDFKPSGFSAQKRSFGSWFSRAHANVHKRRRSTMSINNAMMAITDMLLAEQKERLERNRERIRYHMLVQG